MIQIKTALNISLGWISPVVLCSLIVNKYIYISMFFVQCYYFLKLGLFVINIFSTKIIFIDTPTIFLKIRKLMKIYNDFQLFEIYTKKYTWYTRYDSDKIFISGWDQGWQFF